MASYIVNNQQPYDAAGSGPGAVVFQLPERDPLDSFKSAYSIAHQMKMDKWADEDRKRAKMKEYMGDMDFKTDGIRSKDMGYFQQGKNTLHGFYANALMNGDPSDPAFRKDYEHAQLLKNSYEVAVNSSIDLNKQITAATAELYKNPNKFDFEKSVAKIKDIAQSDLPQAIEKSGSGLLVPKGWQFESWARSFFEAKDSPFKPDQSVRTNSKGQVIETSGYSKWDPNLKSYPKVQEMATWAIRNNPDFRDYVLGKWEELPTGAKQEYAKIAETATKNGNPVTAQDFFANTMLEPFAFTKDAYKGETAGAKESARYYFGKGQVKQEFKADIDRYLLFAGGDNSLFQLRDGKKMSQYFLGKTVGSFKQPDPNNPGKMIPVDDKIISIQHLGKTADGRPIIKYKTTSTEATPGEGLVDADGYITTNDPTDIIYPMIYAEFGKEAPKYVSAFQERSKGLGAWRGSTIDPYSEGVLKLSPGYKLEDVQQQVEDQEEDNPSNHLISPPSSDNSFISDIFNKFKARLSKSPKKDNSQNGGSSTDAPTQKFEY